MNEATIRCKAVLGSLPIGARSYFRLLPINVRTVKEDEFLDRLSVKTGQDGVQVRFWLDNIRDVVYDCLVKNIALDMGFLYAKLFVNGSLPSMTSKPTKEQNPVSAKFHLKGALAEMVKAIEVVNGTVTVPAVLYEFMQDGADGMNKLTEANVRTVINGSRILVEEGVEGTGGWLEHPVTGVKVCDAEIDYSDSSVAYIKFATLPADGRYRFVWSTNDGGDISEISPVKLTRMITVESV